MKKTESNLNHFLSVPCPTCGVRAGKRCELNSAALRSNPHADRRFSAREVLERQAGYQQVRISTKN